METIRLERIGRELSISNNLDYLFSTLGKTEKAADNVVEWVTDDDEQSNLADALLMAYSQITCKKIIAPWLFSVFDQFTFDGQEILHTDQIHCFEHNLRNNPAYDKRLNTAISYLFDELICNIQQHAMCHKCVLYAGVNSVLNSIDICISDNGISLYGSYVKSGRYMDKLGNESVSALVLAKDGFSTKNRPDAENRGYGISSNVKMIVDGLHGTLSIVSGNALYINTGKKQLFVNLPKQIEWQGTTIIVRIPNTLPASFNLYDYIS